MSNTPEQDDRSIELDLLARITRRERAAFEELYARYVNILFATAMKFLKQDADAQDVVQDVFIQIWDKAKLYDPSKGKPLTWALTLTRNRSIDRIRAIQRRTRLRDDFEKETVMMPARKVRFCVPRSVSCPSSNGGLSSWLFFADSPRAKSPKNWASRSARSKPAPAAD